MFFKDAVFCFSQTAFLTRAAVPIPGCSLTLVSSLPPRWKNKPEDACCWINASSFLERRKGGCSCLFLLKGCENRSVQRFLEENYIGLAHRRDTLKPKSLIQRGEDPNFPEILKPPEQLNKYRSQKLKSQIPLPQTSHVQVSPCKWQILFEIEVYLGHFRQTLLKDNRQDSQRAHLWQEFSGFHPLPPLCKTSLSSETRMNEMNQSSKASWDGNAKLQAPTFLWVRSWQPQTGGRQLLTRGRGPSYRAESQPGKQIPLN